MTIDDIDDLMRQHPALKQISDGKAQYSLALARLVFEAEGSARQAKLREIEESIDYLRASEERYCRDNAIPLDYAAPTYACPLCEDRGWLFYDTRKGVAELCRCSIDKRHRRLFAISGLSDAERDKTFDSFDVSYYGEQADQDRARSVLAKCKRFASDVAAGRPVGLGIGIVGGVGRGKTHLLLSIFNYIVANSQRVAPVYCVAAGLFDELRAGFEDDAELTYNDRIAALIDADVLLVDDLGSERWTGWVENTLFKIVNGRMVRGKSMAFSTNLDMEELHQTLGARIYSRIYSSCEILPIRGKDDIRLKRKFESMRPPQ